MQKIWLSLGLVLACGCSSAQKAEKPFVASSKGAVRSPAASSAPLLLAGEWQGYAKLRDSATDLPDPYLCGKLIATAKAVSDSCEVFSVKGQAYEVQFVCKDPLLSSAGQAMFAQKARICEKVAERKYSSAKRRGETFFMTTLNAEEFVDATSRTSYILQLDQYDSNVPPQFSFQLRFYSREKESEYDAVFQRPSAH